MNNTIDKKTGEFIEVKSTPRFVHSMDFETQAVRLKNELSKRVNDDYVVHLEDYENINDMVRRCTITKTRINPETNPLATYDTDEEIAAQLPEYSQEEASSSQAGIESEQEQAVAKQSDGKASSPSDSPASETSLL